MSFNSMPVQRSRWFLYRIPLHSRPQTDINRVDMNSICQIASKYSLALPYLARLLRTKRLSSNTLRFASVGLSMLWHVPASSYVLQACSTLRYGTKTHMGGYLHILRKHTTSSCVPRRIKWRVCYQKYAFSRGHLLHVALILIYHAAFYFKQEKWCKNIKSHGTKMLKEKGKGNNVNGFSR